METYFLVAFSLGVFSTLHCWGMCGGIVSALTISMASERNHAINKRSAYLLALNFGRISSYTVAGMIAGLLSQQINYLMSPGTGHMFMRIAAATMLVLIGLHLTGWFPFLKHLESIGIKVWKYIQPLGKLFIPVNTVTKAFLIGMIWGWLPCALVYSVILWAVTSGSVLNGALIMLSFGLGTLPSMFLAGTAGSSLFNMAKRQAIRKVAGVVIIAFGLASPFIHDDHHMHDSTHFSH